MFSKRTWVVIGLITVAVGVWYSTQTLEYVYSQRFTDQGVRVSKVVCGDAPSILFLEEYDEGVLGPATAADCTSLSRTRFVESIGIALIGLTAAILGYRFGVEHPRPIDDELPRLPDGADRTVEGRKRRGG